MYHAPESLGGPAETWFNLEIETDYGVVTLPIGVVVEQTINIGCGTNEVIWR